MYLRASSAKRRNLSAFSLMRSPTRVPPGRGSLGQGRNLPQRKRGGKRAKRKAPLAGTGGAEQLITVRGVIPVPQ
jgi:hypothetical protein